MEPKKKLIIIGASGHGRVIADMAIKMNKWEDVAFLDDNKSIKKNIDFKVVGSIKDYIKYKDTSNFIIAIGNNKIRKDIDEKLKLDGISMATLIHPDAVIGIDVEIGDGTVIMAGAIINSSTKIGNGCIINTGATIDHDNVIGNYVHVSPGVHTAGGVKIGDGTWIGLGGLISNNINIVSECIVGAGGVVLKDIDIKGTYVGIPVRKLKGEEI